MYARFNFIWERNIDNKKEIQSNKALTTAKTIKKGKILIELDHIWTFMGGKQVGIGNQSKNLWSIYGAELRWNDTKKEAYKISLYSSLERWRVGSGGCFGYNCKNNSNNIFDLGTDKVVNDNLVGSISIPLTWKMKKVLALRIIPSYINIHNTQNSKNGRCKSMVQILRLGLDIKLIID